MRDIAIIATFFLLILPAIRKPFVAVSLWLWTALFYPGGWVYGVGASIRYNLIFSIITIAGMFLVKKQPKKESNGLTILISMFLLWTTITYMVGIGDPDVAREYWIKFIKVIALYYCAAGILVKKIHIDFFLWAIILSVGFYATVESLKFLSTGGSHHIEGIPGHELGDRNDLALAINMSIPLASYLVGQADAKYIRLGLFGVLIMMVVCVLGTYSRGGMLGLIVMGAIYLKGSKNKGLVIFLFIIFIPLAGKILPQEWFNRMDTVKTANNDASFMGRVVAWKISTLIALDRPITGGGFKALETFPVWLSYALELNSKLTFVTTPPPDLENPHAAHSIYFQCLGDQGFVGLFLFLSIGITAFRKMGKCAKLVDPQSPYVSLITMLRLSIIMYFSVGFALSKVYFDLPYAIYAIVRAVERIVLAEHAENQKRLRKR